MRFKHTYLLNDIKFVFLSNENTYSSLVVNSAQGYIVNLLKTVAIPILAATLISCGNPIEQTKPNAEAQTTASPGQKISQNDCSPPEVSIDAAEVTPLTIENYALAESQVIFSDYVKKIGKATCGSGVGTIMHLRNTPDPKDRTILRINFDTIYSFLILDLTSPVTIELPLTNGRYQSAEVLDDQHYIPFIFTKPGRYELTEETVGSRHAIVIFRTQVNIQDPDDMNEVIVLQNGIKVAQQNRGEYSQTNSWDMEDILSMRKQYQQRAVKEGTKSEDMAGKKEDITVDMHNFGAAVGWGGLTKEGAVYLFFQEASAEPKTLRLKDVPTAANAFWSITVYDSDGYPRGEHFNINSAFAQTGAEGDVVVRFGGDPEQENYLEVYPDWTATFRVYSPQEAYFNGQWEIPELQPVE